MGEHERSSRQRIIAPWTSARAVGAPDAAAARRAIGGLLRVGDVRAALGVLNARTRYRFTGLYRAAPPHLRNVALFDRENPTAWLGGDICLLSETYCSIVAGDARPFHTDDATYDPALVEHPARSSVVAYLGVVVCDRRGAAWGTLCHYDVRPRLAPAGELPLMEWMAAAIASQTALIGAD